MKTMEKELPPMQMSIDPNLYGLTNTSIVFDGETFYFSLTSANQLRQFSASPKHAKRILMLLENQIKKYEEQFGELTTQLPKVPETTQEEKKFGF